MWAISSPGRDSTFIYIFDESSSQLGKLKSGQQPAGTDDTGRQQGARQLSPADLQNKTETWTQAGWTLMYSSLKAPAESDLNMNQACSIRTLPRLGQAGGPQGGRFACSAR